MRVAYLGIKGLPARGGAERVVEAIVTRMPAEGIYPTVYCDRQYTPMDVSLPGMELVRLPAVPGKYFRSLTLDFLAACHAVFCGHYDLIHLHNVEASFVLPILRLKYRVVSTSHGAAYWRAKWGPLAKWLMRMMDAPFVRLSTAVTFVSMKDAQEFGARFGKQAAYIPNGVGLEYTSDREGARTLLEHHGLVPGEYWIFVAGRIEPTKGAHLAIEAVNRLSSQTSLLVVGDDMQVPAYGRSLREMAGPRIRFQTPIDKPELLFGLMANACGLIFPSTVEAMSMVLLEAASIGVPVVCSDIVENRQVLQDDAVYFESGSVESLMAQLEWCLGHAEMALAIGGRARQRIRADFAWDTIALRYAELYREVLR